MLTGAPSLTSWGMLEMAWSRVANDWQVICWASVSLGQMTSVYLKSSLFKPHWGTGAGLRMVKTVVGVLNELISE